MVESMKDSGVRTKKVRYSHHITFKLGITLSFRELQLEQGNG